MTKIFIEKVIICIFREKILIQTSKFTLLGKVELILIAEIRPEEPKLLLFERKFQFKKSNIRKFYEKVQIPIFRKKILRNSENVYFLGNTLPKKSKIYSLKEKIPPKESKILLSERKFN